MSAGYEVKISKGIRVKNPIRPIDKWPYRCKTCDKPIAEWLYLTYQECTDCQEIREKKIWETIND